MYRKFFLATLAAVALTLGFTACSDDDENEPSGKYELKVGLRFE